jgi:hypothetical protein
MHLEWHPFLLTDPGLVDGGVLYNEHEFHAMYSGRLIWVPVNHIQRGDNHTQPIEHCVSGLTKQLGQFQTDSAARNSAGYHLAIHGMQLALHTKSCFSKGMGKQTSSAVFGRDKETVEEFKLLPSNCCCGLPVNENITARQMHYFRILVCDLRIYGQSKK